MKRLQLQLMLLIYGVDNTPTRYGTKLNEIGLARHEADYMKD